MKNENDFVKRLIELREKGNSTNEIIDIINNSGMSLEDALNLFIEVCNAIVYYKVQDGGEAAQDIVDALIAEIYDLKTKKEEERRNELQGDASEAGIAPHM